MRRNLAMSSNVRWELKVCSRKSNPSSEGQKRAKVTSMRCTFVMVDVSFVTVAESLTHPYSCAQEVR